MMCEDCKKNSATFHMTEIINGNSKEIHLCEECASKSEEFNSSFTIQDLLAGLLDIPGEHDLKEEFAEDISCSSCCTTYEEFKRGGKFGCGNCYDSFREKLVPLFKNIHGHDTHVGKIPKRTGRVIKKRKDINSLKSRLQESVKHEEFEIAAEIRDEIKKLEAEIEET